MSLLTDVRKLSAYEISSELLNLILDGITPYPIDAPSGLVSILQRPAISRAELLVEEMQRRALAAEAAKQ